jgi:hypothetical protein
VALAVLEKTFKDIASFPLTVRKIFRISEPFKQRPTQGTFLPKISFLVIIVS